MTTTYAACPNPACERGTITTMVGKIIGRASNGCEVRSDTFMVPSNEMCPVCRGCGRITVEIDAEPAETSASAETITYLGEPVDAPGFSQDQFERAMLRALCDDLQITSYHDGRHLVGYQGLYGYVVTRTSCDCKAGRVETPCKHRAFLIAYLDVRQPHIRREWVKLNPQRPTREAVATGSLPATGRRADRANRPTHEAHQSIRCDPPANAVSNATRLGRVRAPRSPWRHVGMVEHLFSCSEP